MYKYILVLLFSAILFSCQKNDVEDLFPQGPDARAGAAIDEVKSDFMVSQYGWLAHFEFNNGKNESFYNIEFKDNGRAIVKYGDMGEVETSQTTYTLSYSSQLDLVFDSRSPFSELVGASGGDFRFELVNVEEGIYYFKSRNNVEEGLGEMQLTRAETPAQFVDLIAMQYNVVNNPEKSFFRVLSMNSGKKYHMDVVSLNKSFIEMLMGTNEIRRMQHKISIIERGFKFNEPVTINGETITHFLSVGNGAFDAYNNSTKVGMLDYGAKAFTAIGNTKKMLDVSDVYMTSGYSRNMQQLIDGLKGFDSSFTAYQFYFYPVVQLPTGVLADLIAVFRTAGNPRWMRLFVKYAYGNDFIRINPTGFAEPGKEEYFEEPAVDRALSAICYDSEVQPFQDFDIVFRDGITYMVQRKDPSLWMIVSSI